MLGPQLPTLLPPTAPPTGKSLSLSITLLRINFVEIKLVLVLTWPRGFSPDCGGRSGVRHPFPDLAAGSAFKGANNLLILLPRHSQPLGDRPWFLGVGGGGGVGGGTTQAPAFSGPGHEEGRTV